MADKERKGSGSRRGTRREQIMHDLATRQELGRLLRGLCEETTSGEVVRAVRHARLLAEGLRAFYLAGDTHLVGGAGQTGMPFSEVFAGAYLSDEPIEN